ncbi:zona pellucida sperm-binding protein 3 [Paramisgurnus dabryanus]|uniref:zona pellucida sperm-binding protein 3 n=1 Tax=Paramisgurnus dabryanus TaxID=90735 RepID=UPI0031F3A61C
MNWFSFLLMLVAPAMAQKDLLIDCRYDTVSISWKPRLDLSEKLDSSRALLGNCAPSFLGSDDSLHFYVSLSDCGFHKQVQVRWVRYSTELLYDRGPGLPLISQTVQCVHDLPVGEVNGADEEVNGADEEVNGADEEVNGADEEVNGADEEVVFSMELMNNEFSGPASSLSFKLGSSIPIRAEVQSPGPLWIFLDRCVMATGSDIRFNSKVHPIVSNSGCLMESKEGNSTFLPRREPSEMRLYIEAFKFALGENIFLHCDLTAWDIHSSKVDGKACHYVKERHRWELLDNPPQSYLCSCCESTCKWRIDTLKGQSARKILGPFIIVEDESERNVSLNTKITEHGLSESPVWLVVMSVAAVLVTVMLVIAVSYYLCFWRGGRLGYRPSRDLLTKY